MQTEKEFGKSYAIRVMFLFKLIICAIEIGYRIYTNEYLASESRLSL